MQCPIGHGDLTAHSTIDATGMTMVYSSCPICHGHWMESWIADDIVLSPEEQATEVAQPDLKKLTCPICQKLLVRHLDTEIPTSIFIYRCPDNHGFFFPAGQLAAYKNIAHMQKKERIVHRTPQILLAVFLGLLLVGGLAPGLGYIGKTQTTASHAQELLVNQKVYVSPAEKSVIISATTSVDAAMTIHLPAMQNFAKEMQSTDLRTHTIFIGNLTPGPHTYYFTITVNGKETQSETFDFTMPE